MAGVSDLDLRLLRVFVTVVEARGFSAAQAVLNVGQSTISNHMAALEQRLGCRLCQRGRGGFRLTEKGQLAYDAARRLLAAAEQYRTETGALRNHLAGNIRLGVVDGTLTDPNAPLTAGLRRFSARDHAVHFHITMDMPTALAPALLDGRLDAAIASFPRQTGGLAYTPLYEEVHGMYCGRGHPLFDRPDSRLGLEDIREHRVVARGYWHLEDVYPLGLRQASAVVFQMEAAAMLVLSGGYIGFLPEHYAAAWVARGEMRRLMPERLRVSCRFDLATRRGNQSLVLDAFASDLIAAHREKRAGQPAARPEPKPSVPVRAARSPTA